MTSRDGIIKLGRVVLGSRTNGPGSRDVFWTTGCSIRCAGCINPQFLESSSGADIPLSAVLDLIEKRAPDIEGVSFSGGEPTDQAAVAARIAAYARSLGLSVVVYTGRTLLDCRKHEEACLLLEQCDVLVAGPYRELPGRASGSIGSAAQTVHFLTPRYCAADLSDLPDVEVLVRGSASAVVGTF